MRLWINGRFPSLNQLLDAKSTQKGSWNSYNALKCEWFGQIKRLVELERVESVGPGYFTFLFVEPDRRRDPDNIVSAGVKLILDSLVGCEVIAGDGWSQVLGYVGYWVQREKRAGCFVVWNETGLTSKAAMEAELEKEWSK